MRSYCESARDKSALSRTGVPGAKGAALAMGGRVTYSPSGFEEGGHMGGPFVRWIAFLVLVTVVAATGFGAMGAG